MDQWGSGSVGKWIGGDVEHWGRRAVGSGSVGN